MIPLMEAWPLYHGHSMSMATPRPQPSPSGPGLGASMGFMRAGATSALGSLACLIPNATVFRLRRT